MGTAFPTHGRSWKNFFRGMALLFVLVHQASAGIVCLCQHEVRVLHAVKKTAKPPAASCHAQMAEEPAEEQAPCSSTSVTAPCCEMHAQISHWADGPIPLITAPAAEAPALLLEKTSFTQQLQLFSMIRPGRSRPLYLVQSCYLI